MNKGKVLRFPAERRRKQPKICRVCGAKSVFVVYPKDQRQPYGMCPFHVDVDKEDR